MSRERLLFLTGRLAHARLERMLKAVGGAVEWRIFDVGVKVAALMTGAILRRRLPDALDADRVIVPGRCRADLDALSAEYQVPFERGPEEIADLPQWLGQGGRPPDLSRHECRIFAEIVDASAQTVAALRARARLMRAEGADVVDLGCLPDTPFPHLEDAVAALKADGCAVSVDSADPQELLRGGRAGADYLLSLTEETLWIAEECAATPVVIPARHGDLDSLVAAVDALAARGRPCLADPVLDPIHFGFTQSLERYAEFRRRRPEADMLMGTGNLTELTDADSVGVTALLMGVCSELAIGNALVVQVSPHTRRTIAEHDAARRLMCAAKADASLPKGYGGGLIGLHDKKPHPYPPAEIQTAAAAVRDANFRIETAEDGVHVYNRDGHRVARDAFDHFPHLGVERDGGHAFYLGYELARAEIAWTLGKRYAQDRPLDWGVAAAAVAEDLTAPQAPGATLKTRLKTRTDA